MAVVYRLHDFDKYGAGRIGGMIGFVQPAQAIAIDAIGVAAIEWLERGKILAGCQDQIAVVPIVTV